MIRSAAIKYPNGEVVAESDRHYKIIELQAGRGIFTKEGAVQGFVNHRGEFLTRAEAKAEALLYGQIPANHKGELFSEDIWPESEAVDGFCD